MENTNLVSFEELANDITLEKDFALLCQCLDMLYYYLNGERGAIRQRHLPGSKMALVRVGRLLRTVLSVFPKNYNDDENKALDALKIIKNKIPFWRRDSLRNEFECVERAIKVKLVWKKPI